MKTFPTHIIAVDGVVENNRGEILLVKQRHTGEWCVPGGQVEVGENLIDGLVREIKEESGIDVIVNELVCVSSNTGTYPGYNGYGIVPTKVMFGFTCTPIGGELGDSDETLESRWICKDDVLNYIRAAALVERFNAYLNFDGNIQYLDYITRPNYDLKLKCKI